jgi:hypothetical protein
MLRGSEESIEEKIHPVKLSSIHKDHLSVSPVGEDSYLFGALSEDGHGLEGSPRDPMAELIVVRGDPESNAQKSNRIAMSFTVLSALFLSLDIFPNLFLVLLFLRHTIP